MLNLIKNHIINLDQNIFSARLYKLYSYFINLGKPNIKFNHQFEIKYKYPQENNLTPIKAYFTDAQNTQPSLIIYKL